ncbi:MAG: hypothetical protein K9M99_04010 [Candidatus Cloacimonetes bacterium]|nr:hypothetical protein [Candidatus Cloacimonadota bacterium]
MKKTFMILLLVTIVYGYSETILRNWKSYTNTTHISDLQVDGNVILLATWGGLLEYDAERGSFAGPIKMEDGLSSNELSALELLSDGTLLVGTKTAGISRIQSGEFKMPLNEDNGLSSAKIYAIESYGEKYVAITDDGISVFSQLPVWPLPAVNNYDQSDGLSSTNYNAIAISNEGILYCGSENGIDYADLNDEELEWQQLNTANSDLGNNYITSISCRDGKVAVGTKSGIYYLENTPAGREIEKYGLDVSYYPVYLDGSGNIWASRGYWDEDELQVLESEDQMLVMFEIGGGQSIIGMDVLGSVTSMVTSIKEFQGGLVISTWGGGILIYDGTWWSEPLMQNCIGANFTTALQMDTRNRLWVGNGILNPPDTRRGNRGLSHWDGYEWVTFNSENSGLTSNNINSIVPLANDHFWFTSYANINSSLAGINVLDYSDTDNPEWDFYHSLHTIDPLPSSSIGNSFLGKDGNIWLCMYNGGIGLYNEATENQHFFMGPDVMYNGRSNAIYVYQGDSYTVVGGWLSGFELWTGEGLPETDDSANWEQPADQDFTNGHVYAAIERHQFYHDEIWIASSKALYMYDGDDWFRYGKESTKRQYLAGTGTTSNWQPQTLDIGVNDSPDWWYFEGQERLYGGVSTYPTALLVDPFNNLWIGTATNGICRYDIENNKFKTWNMENSPLMSNQINDLEYDGETGTMYIATANGLNSVMIGISGIDNQEDELNSMLVYPNPFYPEQDGLVKIENKDHLTMPKGGTICNIYDLEGLLVRELELNNFQQFEWNGNNSAEKKCSSGLYFYLVTSAEGESNRGKIILVR